MRANTLALGVLTGKFQSYDDMVCNDMHIGRTT